MENNDDNQPRPQNDDPVPGGQNNDLMAQLGQILAGPGGPNLLRQIAALGNEAALPIAIPAPPAAPAAPAAQQFANYEGLKQHLTDTNAWDRVRDASEKAREAIIEEHIAGAVHRTVAMAAWKDEHPINNLELGNVMHARLEQEQDEVAFPILLRVRSLIARWNTNKNVGVERMLEQLYNNINDHNVTPERAFYLVTMMVGTEEERVTVTSASVNMTMAEVIETSNAEIIEQQGKEFAINHGEALLDSGLPIFKVAYDQNRPEAVRSKWTSLNVKILTYATELHRTKGTQGGGIPTRRHPFREESMTSSNPEVLQAVREMSDTSGGEFYAPVVNDGRGNSAIDLSRLEQAFLYMYSQQGHMRGQIRSLSASVAGRHRGNRGGRGRGRGSYGGETGTDAAGIDHMIPFDPQTDYSNGHFGQYPPAPEYVAQHQQQREANAQVRNQGWASQSNYWTQARNAAQAQAAQAQAAQAQAQAQAQPAGAGPVPPQQPQAKKAPQPGGAKQPPQPPAGNFRR